MAKEKTQKSNDAADKKATDQKVSELTMMGVQEMLRRGERGEDKRHRWGCWAIILVVLLLVGSLGYYIHQRVDSLSTVPEAAMDLANDWVFHPVEDATAPDKDRFSIRGLQLLLEGAGWKPQDEPGVIDTPTTRKVMQRYRHEEHTVAVTIYDLQERSEVRDLLEQTDPPARAMMFDTKAVVLEPATEADAEYVEGLVMLLEEYRATVLEEAE
ncbi:hypothetical protein FIV42_21570 [Persicimonas caeni]|uniref:Uncharacterized protein n=1 Tax=Persicimonas caeni TaxID=2292766 RepID=A0A4Y6PY52_PERCE|nr:hypothetical protein [Persicimonas caeni]QDG53241.1 hypothetical protein FIV42_21570 [Persicimonas caeni]QED34463.1 hypothetical protein FRD00_21565 [Persicimonas caeni]